MFVIDQVLLVASVLIILAVVSSKLSAQVGLPVLVVFLGLGMLAGSEGPGGIPFEDYRLAHAIGTVALAFILFDGGLNTPRASLRLAWKPAALLATLGVVVTSAVTGLIASHVLGLPLLEGLLLGGIVGSTDAAAVFGLLRSAGVRLRPRLAATLEVESGANDPMAVFLTVGLIQVLSSEVELGPRLLLLFALQMGVGLAVGLLVGRLAVVLLNRIELRTAGLYPVLTASCGALAFGLAAVLHGSGFLAIYVAGIVLGNKRFVFQHGTLVFHDGIAWAGQIAMFVVLGLLSFPSELWHVSGASLLVAAGLTFLGRPLAVLLLLAPFRFSWRELLLISWVGLKGAVPVVLAIYPLLAGLDAGHTIFNVVFFVVLLSAVIQGGSLPWVARWLKLNEPPVADAPLSIEISSVREVETEVVDYLVRDDCLAVGRALRELAFPVGAVVAMITRERVVLSPRGSTCLEAGDHAFVVAQRRCRNALDRIFADPRSRASAQELGEIGLRGEATLSSVADTYGIDIRTAGAGSLEELLLSQIPEPQVGSELQLEPARLRVTEMRDGRVLSINLLVTSGPAGPAAHDHATG